MVEIDCSGPDITVSQVKPEGTTCSSSEPNSQGSEPSGSPVRPESRRRQRLRVVDSDSSQIKQKQKSVRRKGTKKHPKPGKDARARFKSSEDLIHRLYVCISGAADQLQTNFAGDFRSILKYVFIMNSSQDDQEEEEDAPMSESEQNYLRSLPNQAPGPGPASAASIDPRLLSTSPPAGLAAMPVYASNLDYHMGETGVLGAAESESPGPGTERRFYQPEPALLTIASGDRPVVREEAEADLRRERRLEEPPAWIPDSMAPLCMGCGLAFSLVRRRHHCRSCGRVFCAKCSPNQESLRGENSPRLSRVQR